jgi:Tfp pilus assembly protein FimT
VRPTDRAESGTTAVELVVASSLLLLMLGLALPIAVSGLGAASRVVAVARLHGDSRSILTEALRQLRAARPAGVCVDPPGRALAECLLLGDRPSSVLQATGNRVCFATVATAVDGSATVVLPAPDLTCVSRDATDAVTVSTWRPKAVDDCLPGAPRATSYTTPCWDHRAPTRVRVIGRVAHAAPPIFSFLDPAGHRLEPPGPPTLDDATDDAVLTGGVPALARLAAVRLDLRLGYRVNGRSLSADIHVTVAPRGSRYGMERTWAG